MWYQSIYTGKFVRGSSDRLVDSILGKDTFKTYVKSGILREVENPSVIDILRENKSVVLAAVRYQELHNCSRKEAWDGVKLLKKSMASNKDTPETEAEVNPNTKE